MRNARTAFQVLLLAAVSLTAAPRPAVAQEADVEAKLQRVQNRYPESVAERIREVVRRAEEAGVPAEAVVDKALEGAAKGIPGERVLPALSRYADQLRRGRALLGEGAEGAAVKAAADALQRGAPGEQIRQVHGLGRRAQGEGAIPIVVLGDLVELGVSSEQALEAVEAALEAGRGPQELLGLAGKVRRRVRQGMPPGQAVSEAARTLGRGPPEGRPGPPDGAGQGGGPPGGPPVPPGSEPPEKPDRPGGGQGQGQGGGQSGGR